MIAKETVTLMPAIPSKQGPSPDTPLPRRVVTGVSPEGNSVVVIDGPIPQHASVYEPGMGRGSELWIAKGVPVALADLADPLAGYELQEWPARGEVMARTFTWLPGFEFPRHRSNTLDVFFVISGEIELLLDESSTILHPGDTVVQCGTNHGWRVVGTKPCTFAGVLIEASARS